jgi:hypothetical protein
MSLSAGLTAWKLAFQLSPIILTGGVAKALGGMLPLVAITEALNFPTGLLSGAENLDLDDFFANFEPLPGAALLNQDLARYPFGNQGIAANAVIQQPLTFSMLMVTTAKGNLGYFLKLAIFQALQAALQQHNTMGGSYIVLTPSFVYTSCVLRALRDTSNPATRQPQNTWTFDFEAPLLTLSDIESAQSSLMSAISNASQVTGQTPAWSGVGSTIPATIGGTGNALVPAVTNTAGAASLGAPGFTGIAGWNASIAPGQITSTPLAPLGQ